MLRKLMVVYDIHKVSLYIKPLHTLIFLAFHRIFLTEYDIIISHQRPLTWSADLIYN